MPSKSKRQHKWMAWMAHDSKAAKEHGISQKQAQEFIDADRADGKYQGKKHKKPGSSKW